MNSIALWFCMGTLGLGRWLAHTTSIYAEPSTTTTLRTNAGVRYLPATYDERLDDLSQLAVSATVGGMYLTTIRSKCDVFLLTLAAAGSVSIEQHTPRMTGGLCGIAALKAQPYCGGSGVGREYQLSALQSITGNLVITSLTPCMDRLVFLRFGCTPKASLQIPEPDARHVTRRRSFVAFTLMRRWKCGCKTDRRCHSRRVCRAQSKHPLLAADVCIHEQGVGFGLTGMVPRPDWKC